MSRKTLVFLGLGLFLVILFGLGVTIVAFSLLLSPIERNVLPRPPAIESRTILSNFKNKVAWHRNNVQLQHTSSPSPGLLVGYGYVAFVNSAASMANQLNVLDANTGLPLWQSELFPSYEAVAISKDRAFIVLNEGHPLNIYEFRSSGKPIISLNSFDVHTQFFLYPAVTTKNFYLYYDWKNEHSLHEISWTGEEVAEPQVIKAPDSLSSLFLFDQPFYLLTAGAEYIWHDFETKKELWRTPAPGRIDSWPLLLNRTLFISTGNGKNYLLLAIDTQTGRELWRTNEAYGSNVVWYQDGLYALRNDAVLVKFDPRTGQVKAEVPFTPNSINAGAWAYWLASEGERLYIYFGDSQELFALEFKSP